jgi:hypothetical protein
VLVRWDSARGAWTTTDEPVTIDGDSRIAEVSKFSVVDFVTNGAASIGQTVGEWTGKRVQAPNPLRQATALLGQDGSSPR